MSKPIAAERFRASTETSVIKLTNLGTDIDPTTASTRTAIGTAAVNSPPNTQTRHRGATGPHIDAPAFGNDVGCDVTLVTSG